MFIYMVITITLLLQHTGCKILFSPWALFLSLLVWNSTRTCKRRHPFTCFDKWTASTVIPLPNLLQPPWFHSINFQSQRSLCSAAATVIAAPPLAGYSYLYTHSSILPLYSFPSSCKTFTCLSPRKSFVTHDRNIFLFSSNCTLNKPERVLYLSNRGTIISSKIMKINFRFWRSRL